MKLEVYADTDTAAHRAASWLAEAVRAAASSRGLCHLAVSGGGTASPLLRALAAEQVPWERVHLYQVDERSAPDGDSDRNLTQLQAHLLDHIQLPPENLHPMPVVREDLDAAADEYAAELVARRGAPPIFDVAHLGLGTDGHTASLIPDDPVLDTDKEVAATALYAGRRRMTLTYPALNRARQILWLVAGRDKAAPVARLVAGDPGIPAGRIRADAALLVADAEAAADLP